jgi:hypothetical protein
MMEGLVREFQAAVHGRPAQDHHASYGIARMYDKVQN